MSPDVSLTPDLASRLRELAAKRLAQDALFGGVA